MSKSVAVAPRTPGRSGMFRPKIQVGAVPGTIRPSEESQPTNLTIAVFDAHAYHSDRYDLQADLEHLRPACPVHRESTGKGEEGRNGHTATPNRPVVWVDVDGLEDAAFLHRLRDLFGLHVLAMEDVVNVHQRAKCEAYDENTFIVLRMPRGNGRFAVEQVSLFLLDGVVVTFQQWKGDCLDPVRRRLRKDLGKIRRSGADYLAYSIIDAIIDGFFPVLEHYDELLDSISDRISDGGSDDIPQQLHDIRADLLMIRKVARQHKDAILALLRERPAYVHEDTLPYFRDCVDHIDRVIETADTDRETCGELRELYFAQLSQKTNDAMRVLTTIATIFIPMSFVAGLYGMNFDRTSPYNMPELSWALGYPFALVVMVSLGGGLAFFLRRRGWL